MAEEKQDREAPSAPGISLDWWAVIISLVLAVLILIGVLPAIPW